MGLVGNISGSQSHDWQIGLTGSVVVGRPLTAQKHLPEIGTDVVLFVSGARGSKDTTSGNAIYSTTVIGGDLVVSGATYIIPDSGGPEDEVLHNVGSNVDIFLSGTNAVNHQSETIGVGGMGAILLGGDTIISGGLVVGPFDGEHTPPWQVEFGRTDNWGNDTNFVVSGNIGHQGDPWPESYQEGAPHGMTSMFGGDLVVSGALKVGEGRWASNKKTWDGGTISGSIHVTEQNISYLVAGDNVQISSASNGQIFISADVDSASSDLSVGGELLLADGAVGSPALTFTSDTNTGIWRSASDKLNISAGGLEVVEISTTALSGSEIETGLLFCDSGDLEIANDASDKDIIFKISDGGTPRTLLSLNADQGRVRMGDDTSTGNIALQFGGTTDYISGSVTPGHGLGLAIKGKSVWISGSEGVYFGKRTGTQSKDTVGDDVSFFVSGGIASRGLSDAMDHHRGVAVFGGDLVVSGNTYLGSPIGSKIGTNVKTFISGVNGVGLQDETHGLGDNGAILLGGDTVVSGALVVGPNDGDNPADWQVDFGSPEFSGTGIKFIVSGSVGLQGTGENNGHGEQTVVFMGDTVVSGSLTVGERRHDSENTNWYGGTISGSIHETEQGLSYLVAGSNVTIASASNGQVTISSTGGGGGGTTINNATENELVTVASDTDELDAESTLTFDGSKLKMGDLTSGNKSLPGTDATLYISGTTLSQGGDGGIEGGPAGTAIIGGDLVISGVLAGGTVGGDWRTLDIKSHQILITQPGENYYEYTPGSDVLLTISGSVGSKGTADALGTAVIEGDLVTSGTTYIGLDRDSLTEADKQALLVGASSITGSDVSMFFSGAMGDYSNNNKQHTFGTALFGGDLVVSGGLKVFGVSGESGTISGSIHRTEDGLSYLVAGSNVTIASASNGQVIISSTGGGGGGGISFDGSTANGLLTYKDSDEATVESNLTYDGTTLSLNDAIVINEGGGDNNFRLEGSTGKQGMIVIDAGTAQIGLLTNADADASEGYSDTTSATWRAIPADIAMFVSGAIGGKGDVAGHGSAGVTTFGGDLVTSGAAYVGLNVSSLHELDRQLLLVGEPSITGSDVSMFFSGAIGDFSNNNKQHTFGTALFLSLIHI